MHPIPQPEVLDPGRVNADEREDMSAAEHRDRARLLAQALEETSAYAATLWQHLDAVRGYLHDSLPSDPRQPGPEPRSSAAPTGPDDRRGWEEWIATYAAITSVLAGPHGDSGFGLSEAKQAAQLRRYAPNLRLLAEHPETGSVVAQKDAAPQPSRAPSLPSPPKQTMMTARAVSLGVLSALAIRGLVAERALRRARP